MVCVLRANVQAALTFRAILGDVIYFRRLGQHNLILDSPAVITEFLEKRAANTSDRVLSPSIVLCVPPALTNPTRP